MSEFVFVLALALGCPLGDVLAMSVREFSCWAKRYGRECFGEERADLRSGIVASIVANANRGKHSRVARVTDFMPYYRARPRTTDASLLALCKARAGVS